MTEQILYQLDRNSSGQIIWKDGQKEEIIRLYVEEHMSMNKLRELFGGLHYNTIKKILLDNGIQPRTRAQSHYQDNREENIFEVIDTEEKAYWLGFLAADGCVHGNYIIISLQGKDKEHLEKFKKFLKADSITIRETTRVDTKGKLRPYCHFSIGCKKMVEDLKKLGIVERKSLILKPPVIDEKFYYDWIRGFFDGDGGLSYSKKNNRWQSYANSTKEVLQWITNVLNINTTPFQQQHYGKKDNVWRIHFNGRINVYNVWNKIMHDNKATIYLERKYQKYLQLRKTFK